jgi:choline dehydrogenase-like flavoprotein
MIGSFHELEPGARLSADVCIIGAGAAGITMAKELAGSHRDVLVLEGGGLEGDAAGQALYDGDLVGAPYFALDTARLRFFGGSTNHWGGMCRPLDPIDFEARDWLPHSGWPINRTTLDPFYARAQAYCDVGDYNYDEFQHAALRGKLVAFDPERIRHRLWRMSPPTRFGAKYRNALAEAGNVKIILDANVVELVPSHDAATVRDIRLRGLDGKEAAVSARTVVLACGGIENPRLMLLSDSVQKAGLGNGNDLVGRFFTEHPHAIVGFAVPTGKPLDFFEAYFGSGSVAEKGIGLQVKAGLTEAMQREHKLANGCIEIGWGWDRSRGYSAARRWAKALRDDHRLPDHPLQDTIDMLADIDSTIGGAVRRLRRENVLWFGSDFEQAPNPDSRVMLSARRDALGLRRVALDWRLSAIDKVSPRLGARIVAEDLARLGMARTRIQEWVLTKDAIWEELEGRYHHMGTTRMSDSPRTGVVDANCKVHGLSNLYIAGSSVFTTGGYCNPTLTIVALAIRLADHLKGAAERMESGPSAITTKAVLKL